MRMPRGPGAIQKYLRHSAHERLGFGEPVGGHDPSSTVWRVTKSKDPLLMRVCGRAAASESKM